jgi:Ca2+-binding RTX toxin-like protein
VVADSSSGNNAITTVNPASVFLQPGDTISSAAATTVYGGGSGTATFALTGANSSVTGGAGYISGAASGANTTLIGGTGGGSFTVGGGASGSLAVAGQSPGTTNITLAETTGGAEVATNPLGNSGTLVATLSSAGADTVVGGGGASTIHGGGGNDVFAFVNGHAGGTEVITGFTTSDTFAFGGYGYSATNVPTETVTGGNDMITLTDGTQITLVGIDHKVF